MDQAMAIWAAIDAYLNALDGVWAFALGVGAAWTISFVWSVLGSTYKRRLDARRDEIPARPPPVASPPRPRPTDDNDVPRQMRPSQSAPAPDVHNVPQPGPVASAPAPKDNNDEEWRPPIGGQPNDPPELDVDAFEREFRGWRGERDADAGGIDALMDDDDLGDVEEADDGPAADDADTGAAPEPVAAPPDASPRMTDRSERELSISEAVKAMPSGRVLRPRVRLEDRGKPSSRVELQDEDFLMEDFVIEGAVDGPVDPISCTVFAPEAAQIGEPILIQAMIHPESEFAHAFSVARAADPSADQRVGQVIAETLETGQTVTASLEIPGAQIDPPRQSVIWRERTVGLQFSAVFNAPRPAGSSLAKVRIYVDDLPIASAFWRVEVQADPIEPERPTPVRANRYARAFISYASEDREEVLKRVQSLNALGVEVFVDLLSLDPGTRWQRQLYESIDEADAFLLFWSRHSAASEWVEKEWRYALARAERMDDGAPDIRPIILEAPPPPPPPELSDLHFNDASAYVIAAMDKS